MTQNQTFNSSWFVDAAFVDVNYVNYKHILNLKCGQDLESESLSRFWNWRLVQSVRLKNVNILKLKNIPIIIIKLEFGLEYDADERACWYVLSITPSPIVDWRNNLSVYNCNKFWKSTTNSCSCRYLAYGIHLHIWDKQKVFQFDLGLAFGSVVMGLVVLLDLKSLAVECLGNMPWE